MAILFIMTRDNGAYKRGTPVDWVPNGTPLSDTMLSTYACVQVPDAVAVSAVEWNPDQTDAAGDRFTNKQKYRFTLPAVAARIAGLTGPQRAALVTSWQNEREVVPVRVAALVAGDLTPAPE